MILSRIRTLVCSVLLALGSVVGAQEFSALARLDTTQSGADDGFRSTTVALYLSQPVPYRVFTLDEPRRLVMDFRELDFRGIDAAAHRGALATGTVAVLAGGADVIYPRENTEVYNSIKETGVILSEMPFGTQPQARHFPRRNRIISGLALGVLVVEATHRSGTLITARLASEQGREVFAIPGSPLDPRSKGPNSLIKQGAQLTESIDDILEVLSLMDERRISEPQYDLFYIPDSKMVEDETMNSDLSAAQVIIKEKLSHTAIAIDDLIRLTELDTSVVQTVLLELELAGEITRHAGNRVSFC